MNRIVILPFAALGLIALSVASCAPREQAPADPQPVPTGAEVAEPPKPDRFTTTVLLTDTNWGRVKTAMIVDNNDGCIYTMVVPEAPKPMIVNGRWAGCETDKGPPSTTTTTTTVQPATPAPAATTETVQ